MDLRKHTTILMNGLIVTVPVLVTAYVVIKAVLWLDALILVWLPGLLGWQAAGIASAEQIPWYLHGIGLLVSLVVLYAVGLLARNWLFSKALAVAEWAVERIPLVKSIYTAVRDMLQLFSTDEKKTGGQPVAITMQDGQTQMLGMVMREDATALVQADDERVAVYLPMSYQLGGYTVFVSRERVKPLEDMSVERLLKLAMTGGAGVEKSPSKRTAQGMPHTGEQQTEGNTTSTSEQTEEDTTDGAE